MITLNQLRLFLAFLAYNSPSMAYSNLSSIVASITTHDNPIYFLLMQYLLSRVFALFNHCTGTYFLKSAYNAVTPCQKNFKFEINILDTQDFSVRLF